MLAAVLAAAAVGLTLTASAVAPAGESVPVREVAALFLVLVVAGFLQLQVRYGDEVDASDLFEVVLAPILFVLAPPVAVILTATAKAVSQALLRVAPVKAVFNVAQWACAAGAGALVLAVGRAWQHPRPPAELLVLAVALIAVAAVNHVAVLLVLRLLDDETTEQDEVARGLAVAETRRRRVLDAASFAVNFSFGLLLTAAYLASPWFILVALLPLIVLNRAQRLAAARAADLERVDELRAASRALLVDDPWDALPTFLDRVCRGLGADAVELLLADDDGLVGYRVSPSAPLFEWRVPVDDSSSEPLLGLSEALLVPPDPVPDDLAGGLRQRGHRNLLAAPLERPGTARGVLCVYDRTGLRGFGANLRQVLDLLSRELAGALARGELRRRSEADRARFAALVQGSSDLVLIVEPGSVVRFASPAAQRVLGRHPDDLIGRPLVEVFAEHQAPDIRQWLAETAGDPNGILPLDLTLPVPGRLPRHVQAISRNLLDDDAVGGIVVNARDVSESRRTQALMQRQAEVLELIAADAPLQRTLRMVAGTVEELLPASHCVVHVGGELDSCFATSAVIDDDVVARLAQQLGPATPPTADGAPGLAPDPLLVEDVDRDGDRLAPDLRAWLLEHEIAACWIWPLVERRERRFSGCVAVLLERPRRPSSTDSRLVDLAAKLAANAVDRCRERQQLAYQATHDALTGLANRTVLRDHITLALARMRRTGSAVAVVFADLDNFKIINDSLGHRVGDALLQEVSRRLLGLVRPGDTVARLGGDEFVVLCGDLADQAGAIAVAERLLDLLTEVVQVDGHEFYVTASLGIALAVRPGQNPDLLVENADAAMYRAKAKGGNCYQLFDDTMRSAAARQLATSTSLRQAFRRGEFRVHYQPTVDLDTGRVTGVEALVRWEHPTRGLLAPADFITVAEETGMIVPLGGLVLHESCRQVARWRAENGGRPLELAVNLSPRQFGTGDIVAVVEGALKESGLDACALNLEITESSLLEDAVDLWDSLRGLREVGVRVSIDDFGTGYSSLSYLSKLPVDTLKLDQSFVRHVADGGSDRAIAEMVMGLGRTLGLRTVAEGIETERQLRTLQQLGCDVGQGYLLGRAVPSDVLVLDDISTVTAVRSSG